MLDRLTILILYLHALRMERIQHPPFLKAAIGESVTMTCTITGGAANCHTNKWYVQQPGKPLHMIMNDERIFTAGGLIEYTCTLKIKYIMENDSGMYFCTDCSTVYSDFGNGTKLIVTDKSQHNPEVFILSPSDFEIKSRNTSTIFCLVCNVSSTQVVISWTVAGKFMKGMTDLTKFAQDGNHCMKSQLIIPAIIWNNGINCTCVVEIEPGKAITKSIWKGHPETLSSTSTIQYVFDCVAFGISALLFVAVIITTVYYQNKLWKGNRKHNLKKMSQRKDSQRKSLSTENRLATT
ncbi:Ig heavy chain Mem5-like [Protopterus annectens]|uniref:Ig heavy chain Mem5-like n=1 Tax=Protopterus annectens TaxID=7888 RepID=UPI001CFBF2C9|nr:Ig heavy chain Mem5-like [Protopterus annectens]